MRILIPSTALLVGFLLQSVFCGCEKRAQDPNSTRLAVEASALAKFKTESAKLTEWAAERRPRRVERPVVAAEWKFVTELEKRLKTMTDKDLPDDLENALEEYVRVFHEHPDLVEPKLRPRRDILIDTHARQLTAFAAEIAPVRERLRAAGQKHGVELGELVEEW